MEIAKKYYLQYHPNNQIFRSKPYKNVQDLYAEIYKIPVRGEKK